jgi:hypothetical protein
VNEFVDDQPWRTAEPFELTVEVPSAWHGSEALHPVVCGRERDPAAVASCLNAEREGQVGDAQS